MHASDSERVFLMKPLLQICVSLFVLYMYGSCGFRTFMISVVWHVHCDACVEMLCLYDFWLVADFVLL